MSTICRFADTEDVRSRPCSDSLRGMASATDLKRQLSSIYPRVPRKPTGPNLLEMTGRTAALRCWLRVRLGWFLLCKSCFSSAIYIC